MENSAGAELQGKTVGWIDRSITTAALRGIISRDSLQFYVLQRSRGPFVKINQSAFSSADDSHPLATPKVTKLKPKLNIFAWSSSLNAING